MRTNYEMTEAELVIILDACKPTPVMYLSGGRPLCNTQQENANQAWKLLGDTYGFDHMTVQPTGQGDRVFSAEPKT